MGRKRCIRKHYELKTPFNAIEGARVMDDDRLAQLKARDQCAIDAFRTGAATTDDWLTICNVANFAEVLCEWGVGKEEVLPVVQEVWRHLTDCRSRFDRTAKMGATGPALTAFAELMEYHTLQRTSIALSVYEKAVLTVINRINARHPSVKVCLSTPRKETA